jgi:hypothetical protein
LGRFYKQFLTSLYRSTLFGIFLKPKIFTSWTKATLLRIYFRNLSVQRSFLQYKSQCFEKVNVKYVIKRLWHEEIRFYAYLYASSFIILWHIIFEKTAQIPEVEFGGEYGYMRAKRANTDICPVFVLRVNNQHWLLAIIGHAKTNILQQNMW